MSPIVPGPPAEGRVAGSVEILGDADRGEGGYGNVYVTIFLSASIGVSKSEFRIKDQGLRFQGPARFGLLLIVVDSLGVLGGSIPT